MSMIDPRSHLSQEAQRQKEMARKLRNAWRLTPATFAVKTSGHTGPKWLPARHLKIISSEVAKACAKGYGRIIVEMPPRHGKSELISVHSHAWHLERYPDRYTMGVSYGIDLATDFSVRVRDTFMSEDLHPLLHTRIGKKKADRFMTEDGGGLTAAGIGGPITGRGGHFITVDDYLKNAEESLSETLRNKIWDWFLSTLWTRREPGCTVVILATRWHVDDLIGRVLVEMPHENWHRIRLPAIAEAYDPLGREIGEALWPERFDIEELQKTKLSLGTYWFNAMYQQDPPESMAGMNIGDCIHIIDRSDLPHMSSFDKTVRAWDFSSTQDGGDWTAGPLMARHKPTKDTYIFDLPHFQCSPGNLENRVKAKAEADGPGVPIWIEQEPGSSGKIVIDHYDKTVLKGYNVNGEKATGPLEVRAQPFLAGAEAGKVYMLKDVWNEVVRKQINAFPDGVNDDILVALALGYRQLHGKKSGGLTFGRDLGDNNVIQRPTIQQVQKFGKQVRSTGATWGR